MSNAKFGDLAFVKENQLKGNYLFGHFSLSQSLLNAPTPESQLSLGEVEFKLRWVFFEELSKIDNISNNQVRLKKISKLKSSGFDFSKYFYIIKESNFSQPSDMLSDNRIPGVFLTPSGGNGNTDFILASMNVVMNDFLQLQVGEVIERFSPADIQTLEQQLQLPNLQVIDGSIRISDLFQNPNPM